MIANLHRFAVDAKCAGHAARREEFKGVTLVFAEGWVTTTAGFEPLQEPASLLDPRRVDTGRRGESIHVKVRRAGVLRDKQRIVSWPEEPGVLTRPGQRTFGERVRKRDAARDAVAARPQVIERSSVARPVTS